MPDSAEILLILTSVGTRADAERLARAMVEQRLAACAQISAIDSVYRWQGALQAEPEFRLLFKTAIERGPALQAALRAGHPYDLPAIVCLTAQASCEFAAWVAQACTDAPGGPA